MEVEIRDRTLRQLYVDAKAQSPFPPQVVRRFQFVVGLIRAAPDERQFGQFGKGLGFEKLKGARSGQYSFRLNDQFRLVVEISGEAPRKIVGVIEIVDYHA